MSIYSHSLFPCFLCSSFSFSSTSTPSSSLPSAHLCHPTHPPTAGAILEGPDQTNVAQLVTMAFGLILKIAATDAHPLAKESAMWTVSRICMICPETIGEQMLPQVMQVIDIGLRDAPKIANMTCTAVNNLAGASDVNEHTPTSLLSPFFTGLAQALWVASQRYAPCTCECAQARTHCAHTLSI